jgi:hypothetical protein
MNTERLRELAAAISHVYEEIAATHNPEYADVLAFLGEAYGEMIFVAYIKELQHECGRRKSERNQRLGDGRDDGERGPEPGIPLW